MFCYGFMNELCFKLKDMKVIGIFRLKTKLFCLAAQRTWRRTGHVCRHTSVGTSHAIWQKRMESGRV